MNSLVAASNGARSPSPPRNRLGFRPLQQPFRDPLYLQPRELPHEPSPEPPPGPVIRASRRARTATLAVYRNAVLTGRFISSVYHSPQLRLFIRKTREFLHTQNRRHADTTRTPTPTAYVQAPNNQSNEYAFKRVRLTCPGAWPLSPSPGPESERQPDDEDRRRKTPGPTPDVQDAQRIFDEYFSPTPQPDGMLNRASMRSQRHYYWQSPSPEEVARPQHRRYINPRSSRPPPSYSKQGRISHGPCSQPGWYAKAPSTTPTSSTSPEAQRFVTSPPSDERINHWRVPSPTPTSSSGYSNVSGTVMQSIEIPEDYTFPESPLQYRSASEHISTPHPRVHRILWAEEGRSEPPRQRHNDVISNHDLKRRASGRFAPFATTSNIVAHPPKRRSPSSTSSSRVKFTEDDEYINDGCYQCYNCGAKNKPRSKSIVSILKKTRPNKYIDRRSYGQHSSRHSWQRRSTEAYQYSPEYIYIDEDGYDHDMGNLPEAPSPYVKRGKGKHDPNEERLTVSWQPSYKYGLQHPRPLFYDDNEAANGRLRQSLDDELFTKHRGDAEPSISPLKSDASPSPVKFPPSDDTPAKNERFPSHSNLISENLRIWGRKHPAENNYRKIATPRSRGLSKTHAAEQEMIEAERREEQRLKQEEHEAAVRKNEEIQDKLRQEEEEKHNARARAANFQTEVARQTEEEEEQAGRDAEAHAVHNWKPHFAVQVIDDNTHDELNRILEEFENGRKKKDLSFLATPVAKDSFITYRELETIFSGIGWLNDEVVNKFIGDAIALSLKNEGYVKSNTTEGPPVHAFSSAMYNTYQDKGYAGVSRWFTRARVGGKNLLKTDAVFIPVNTGCHWVLLVIFGRKKEYAVLDSMAGIPAKIETVYKTFALDLIKGTLGDDYRKDEWKMARYVSSQQKNGSDCGVFVCLNALAVMRGLEPESAILGGYEEMRTGRNMIGGVLIRGGFEAAGVAF